jgi:hypothetical protein
MVGSALAPLCPPRRVTSVAAIHFLVASRPEKAKLDPIGDFVYPKAKRVCHGEEEDVHF